MLYNMLSEQIHMHDCSFTTYSTVIIKIIIVKQASCSPEVTVHVEMLKQCAAYEITSLARRKVVMETNPVHEQVKMNIPQ